MEGIVEILADKLGDAWNVKLKPGSQLHCESALLEQPISRTVLLIESNETK